MKKSLLTAFLLLLGASNAFAVKGLEGLEGLEPKYALATAGLGLVAAFIGLVTGRANREALFSLAIACLVVGLVPLVGWVNALVLLGALAVVVLGFLGLRFARGNRRNISARNAAPLITQLNPSPQTASTGQTKGPANRPYIHLKKQRRSTVKVRIEFHGTPSLADAVAIANGLDSWKAGPRNLHGTGVYFAGRKTAEGYAGLVGGLVEVEIAAPHSEFADRDEVVNSDEFKQWRKVYSTGNLGHDIAIFVTTVRRQRFLNVDGDVIVALVPPAEADELVHIEGVRVVAVYDMQGNRVY